MDQHHDHAAADETPHFEYAANGVDDGSPVFSRRRVLVGLGIAGMGAAVIRTAFVGSAAASAASSCVGEIPEETAGPYPGDGSNGPDVLNQSGIVRSDIRSSFGSASGTAAGVPTTLDLSFVNSNDCSPLTGAAVYLWHCNRDGEYSLYGRGITDQNYLRGVQVTDGDGRITFTTIFPACYSGRWPHIHVEVYPDAASVTDASSKLATSQFALPEDTCKTVYANAPGYSASQSNLSKTSLGSDMVFKDGSSLQLMSASGSVADGYVLGAVAGIDAPVRATTATVTNGFASTSPVRVLDTRTGTGTGTVAKVGAASTIALSLASAVPSDATAAVVNLTAVASTASGYLTAYPTGGARPTASNLNFVPGDVVPNLAVVKLGTNRSLTIYNSAGTTDVVADLAGWFAPSATGRFVPSRPTRVLDTRDGTGTGTAAKLGDSATLALSLADAVPAGATAVVLNLTGTAPTIGTYLTAFPTGATKPLASNVNLAAGQTAPNLVAVAVGTGRSVSIFNNAGTVDVVADLCGWFTDAATEVFVPLTPTRVLDTRSGVGTGSAGKVGAGGTLPVSLTSILPSGATAAVLNVTATDPTAGSYVTAYPTGTSRPVASNLNVAAGQTVANLVTVKLGGDRSLTLYNVAGTVDLVADLAGYYLPAD